MDLHHAEHWPSVNGENESGRLKVLFSIHNLSSVFLMLQSKTKYNNSKIRSPFPMATLVCLCVFSVTES